MDTRFDIAARYFKRAEELQKLAEAAGNPVLREAYLDSAKHYESKAQEAQLYISQPGH